MWTTRVWAPDAAAVEVVTADAAWPLTAVDGGHWVAAVPLAPGDDYRLRVDGGEPLPDPRSRYQPEGVHGPSRVVDVSAFPWTDAGWTGPDPDQLSIYELHVGTFTPGGTLDAAAVRLDHLVSLGVTAVELMPLADFPGSRGWGYDGVHLWAVHRAYGGPEALCRFVDAAHALGIAVILDVVYNHLGPDGNVLGRFGPYFTSRYATPWGEAINVDGAGSDGVRAFIVENALMWLREHHLDGLRLDAVHAIVDTSAVHLLEELGTAVHGLGVSLGRRLLVIAESDANDPRPVRPVEVGGYGLDAEWSDDLHHALWAALSGERDGYYADYGPVADIGTALATGVVYAGRHSRVRDRRHGRSHDGVALDRLVACIQNHDQVGNRALGDRSGSRLDPAALRAAAATVLLAPQTPLLFMGEEWGATTPFQYFTDHESPELAAAVSAGRRREFAAFGWREDEVPDPQDPASFTRSRLDWEEAEREPHASLLAWYRELLALRRAWPDLRGGGRPEVVVDESRRVLVMRRGRLTLAWNLGEAAALLPGVVTPGRLVAGDPATAVAGQDGVELAPGATAVWAAG